MEKIVSAIVLTSNLSTKQLKIFNQLYPNYNDDFIPLIEHITSASTRDNNKMYKWYCLPDDKYKKMCLSLESLYLHEDMVSEMINAL